MRGSLTSQEIFPLFPMAELFGDISEFCNDNLELVKDLADASYMP